MSFDRRGTGPDDDAPSDDDAGVLYEDQVEPEYGIIGTPVSCTAFRPSS